MINNIISIVAFLFAILFCIGGRGAIEYVEDHGMNLITAWIFSGILYNPMIGILASSFSEANQIFLIALVVYDMVVPMGFLFYYGFKGNKMNKA